MTAKNKQQTNKKQKNDIISRSV